MHLLLDAPYVPGVLAELDAACLPSFVSVPNFCLCAEMATHKSKCHLTSPPPQKKKQFTVLLRFLQHSDKAAATNRVAVPLRKLIGAMGKCKVRDIALLAYGLKDEPRTKNKGSETTGSTRPSKAGGGIKHMSSSVPVPSTLSVSGITTAARAVGSPAMTRSTTGKSSTRVLFTGWKRISQQ